jgi:predicted O-methyltransferase YrrM
MRTWQDIPGWFDFHELYQAQVERAVEPARFVEVGSWLGRSTAYMAQCIVQSRKPIRFYTVDHGLGSPIGDDATFRFWVEKGGGTTLGLLHRFLLECGLSEQVVILGTTSQFASELFVDETLDFVFIDGDHQYQSVRADLASWWPKVKPGGILAGHDYTYHASVAEAVHDAFGKGNLGSSLSPTCWEVVKAQAECR